MALKMFSLWRETAGVFRKPAVMFFAGTWRRCPTLPVWHHGPVISLGKYGRDYDWVKAVNTGGYVYEWTEEGKVRHPVLSRLFRPRYELPIWLAFHVYNQDTWWKTKYDDYRFEFPGQFTIVAFGLAVSWRTKSPLQRTWPDGQHRDDDDDYWECVLYYLEHIRKIGDPLEALKKTAIEVGTWLVGKEQRRVWRMKPEYIADGEMRRRFAEWQSEQQFGVRGDGEPDAEAE